MNHPQSLFRTNTFKASTITLIAGLVAITVDCSYDRRYPTKSEATSVVALFTAYSWALIGRGQNSPVYTPHGLPGADKEDFYLPNYLEKVKNDR